MTFWFCDAYQIFKLNEKSVLNQAYQKDDTKKIQIIEITKQSLTDRKMVCLEGALRFQNKPACLAILSFSDKIRHQVLMVHRYLNRKTKQVTW